MGETWTNEKIISDVLGRGADIDIGAKDGSWRLSRWRQFVGSYNLPALPNPTFVVHIAGKPKVRTWIHDEWSESASIPGCATIVPSGQPTGWLVDGELDVVTLSIANAALKGSAVSSQFDKLRFAFSDPLGVALTRQVLTELYAPQDEDRKLYLSTLVDALKAHMLRGPISANEKKFPISDFAAYRLHAIMNRVTEAPDGSYSIEEMADDAGLTPSHFCRVFRKATGMSPHQFVMKTRLDKAQEMLSSTDMPIAHIADMLGFTSQSHFTRAFRNFSGRTPGSWRRSMPN